MTSALRWSGWSAPRPGRFTPGNDPVPIVQKAGWAPGPVWTVAENLALTGIRSPDRPVRSESLYRMSYPGRHRYLLLDLIHCYTWQVARSSKWTPCTALLVLLFEGPCAPCYCPLSTAINTLQAGRPGISSSICSRKSIYSVFWNVCIDWGFHPTSCKMSTRFSLSRLRWLEREADHSCPSSSKIRNVCDYTFSHPHIFTASFLIMHGEKVYFCVHIKTNIRCT